MAFNQSNDDSDELELENSERFVSQHDERNGRPGPVLREQDERKGRLVPVLREQFDSRDFHHNRPRATGERPPEDTTIVYPHGRSPKFILRHEDPAEYEALHKKWWDEYQPSGHIEETLVQLLIDNHWLFKRARLRLEQVEWEMPLNAKHWIESYQKQVEIFTRFKTTAERAFQRAFREVEGYFRECVRSENMAHKAELMRLKIEAQIAHKPEEVNQIDVKMATPLYRDGRDRAAARKRTKNEPLPLIPSAPSPPN